MSYIETQGDFSRKFGLVATDPDLPVLDVLLWGFRTGLLPKRLHGTNTLARNLISELTLRVQRNAATFLVAHSMGGLVVLQALNHEMQNGRAQEHPARSTRLISLFATPTKGTAFTSRVTSFFDRWKLPRRTVNQQIRSLCGQPCDSIISEAIDRIYSPSRDSRQARRIPIRMILGSSDSVIDEESRPT